jgi:polyhydroxyalkanoate synthesis regulator phasin
MKLESEISKIKKMVSSGKMTKEKSKPALKKLKAAWNNLATDELKSEMGIGYNKRGGFVISKHQQGGSIQDAIAKMSPEQAKSKLTKLQEMVSSGQMTKEEAQPIAEMLMRVLKGR